MHRRDPAGTARHTPRRRGRGSGWLMAPNTRPGALTGFHPARASVGTQQGPGCSGSFSPGPWSLVAAGAWTDPRASQTRNLEANRRHWVSTLRFSEAPGHLSSGWRLHSDVSVCRLEPGTQGHVDCWVCSVKPCLTQHPALRTRARGNRARGRPRLTGGLLASR